MGGGVILDGIHEVDYLSWFFGDVVSVSCSSAKLSELDIDVEDYAHLNIRHASGVRSEIHLDYLRKYKRRGLEIVGTEGSLIWLSEGKIPEHCSVRLHTIANGWETVFEDSSLDASDIYLELLENFLTTINNGGSNNLLKGETAYMELAAAVAAHSSAREGKLIHPQKIK
jgi:predicted dehydrogenase